MHCTVFMIPAVSIMTLARIIRPIPLSIPITPTHVLTAR